MKKSFLILPALLCFYSCEKIEEKVQQTVDKTAQKVKDKSVEIVKETVTKQVDETIRKITNSKDVLFSDIFIGNSLPTLHAVKGKSVQLPSGLNATVFQYKMDKKSLLKFLENQSTTDEINSDKLAKKIDGEKLMSRLKLIEAFLPKELTDSPVFQSSKDNKSLEFYRINRIPVQSTLIYDPKDSTFYHLVEAKIEK